MNKPPAMAARLASPLFEAFEAQSPQLGAVLGHQKRRAVYRDPQSGEACGSGSGAKTGCFFFIFQRGVERICEKCLFFCQKRGKM